MKHLFFTLLSRTWISLLPLWMQLQCTSLTAVTEALNFSAPLVGTPADLRQRGEGRSWKRLMWNHPVNLQRVVFYTKFGIQLTFSKNVLNENRIKADIFYSYQKSLFFPDPPTTTADTHTHTHTGMRAHTHTHKNLSVTTWDISQRVAQITHN